VPGSGADSAPGQAQSACPYGERARFAILAVWRRGTPGGYPEVGNADMQGRHEACPYVAMAGNAGRRGTPGGYPEVGNADMQGRHKACPYRERGAR